MVDLADLLKQKPVGSIESSLGKLWIFSCSMKDQRELDKKLSQKLEKTVPEDFVRAFVQFVCFPEGSLKEGQFKPESPILSDSELLKLTEEDLEEFAQVYVKNNRYLFREREYERTKDSDGTIGVRPQEGKIEHPRDAEESFVDYLHRLTLIERERQREQAEKLMNSFTGFSSGLAESLRKNLAHGDALRRAAGHLRPELTDHNFVVEPKVQSVDWAELHRNAEEARLAPFRDLAERLDQLVESSAQASEFMVEANELQAQIAEEIKRSGDSASSFSKITLWLSVVIIILTVVGLGATAYSLYEGSRQAELRNEFNESALQSISGNLNDFTDGISRDRAESRIVLDRQLGVLERITSTLEEVERGQSATESLLKALSEENAELRAEVVELQNRIEESERSND